MSIICQALKRMLGQNNKNNWSLHSQSIKDKQQEKKASLRNSFYLKEKLELIKGKLEAGRTYAKNTNFHQT